jgi:hypothetical protein
MIDYYQKCSLRLNLREGAIKRKHRNTSFQAIATADEELRFHKTMNGIGEFIYDCCTCFEDRLGFRSPNIMRSQSKY